MKYVAKLYDNGDPDGKRIVIDQADDENVRGCVGRYSHYNLETGDSYDFTVGDTPGAALQVLLDSVIKERIKIDQRLDELARDEDELREMIKSYPHEQ